MQSASYDPHSFSAASELLFLAHRGDLPALKGMLDYGVPIDARSEYGSTALHAASWSGQPTIVAFLLLHGADINAIDIDGLTPAMHAASSGSSACLPLLLAAGCDASVSTAHGTTALMFAVTGNSIIEHRISRRFERCIRLLFEAGVDLSAVDDQGQRAEDIALAHGWTDWAGRLRSERERRAFDAVAIAAAPARRALRV